MGRLDKMVELVELPMELLCQVLGHLPIQTLLRLSSLCRTLHAAVALHLQQCPRLELAPQGETLPLNFNDFHLFALLKRCPRLETLCGIRPAAILSRRVRGMPPALTVPGVLDALAQCSSLRAVETDNLTLVEALLHSMSHIYIMGHFFNSEGSIPPQNNFRLRISPNPNINCLNLTGVEVPELVAMPRVQQLDLNFVRFTKPHPFQNFSCPNMRIFTMRHCEGPDLGLTYLPLMIALGNAHSLFRLELNDVPLLGGLVQRTVENKWPSGGFCNLKSLTIAGCKKMLEADVGHLMTASSQTLECLNLQPQLAKDTVFQSLSYAQIQIPNLKSLHVGYVDPEPSPIDPDPSDGPASLSDLGLEMMAGVCPDLRYLWLQDCPHLVQPQPQPLAHLTDLILCHCLCLQPDALAYLVAGLPNLKTLTVSKMLHQKQKHTISTSQRLVSQNQNRMSICIHFGGQQSEHLGLKLTSSSLISLTLVNCGIAKLTISHCPQLMHLEMDDLNNIKEFEVISSPSLSRINILCCPKLENSTILDVALGTPARRARFVFVEPSREQIPRLRDLEAELRKHKLVHNHAVCLFQEITFSLEPSSPCRESILVWLRLANRLVTVFCKKMETQNQPPPTPTFYTGQDLQVIEGPLPNGSFKMTTTIPWLRYLWRVDEAPDPSWIEMPVVDSFGAKHYMECEEKVEEPMARRYPELHSSHICLYLFLPAVGEKS